MVKTKTSVILTHKQELSKCECCHNGMPAQKWIISLFFMLDVVLPILLNYKMLRIIKRYVLI
ncbi:MAG: hypothetical protein CV087_13445 [Candidatus Brocadia sp. WS118]|nr:MAG: hypothetical protein CV087_13445 [Candidatus Brocadia sp. WS118]